VRLQVEPGNKTEMSEIPPQVPPQYAQYPRPGTRYAERNPRGPAQFDTDVIGEAWRLVQRNLGVWVAAELLFGVLQFGVGRGEDLVFNLAGIASKPGDPMSNIYKYALIRLLLGMPTGILLAAMRVGLFNIAIKQIRGDLTSPLDVFSYRGQFVPLLGATVIVTFASDFGCLLLLIPGMLIASLFIFVDPLILERQMSVGDALRLSWQTVRPTMWSALGVLFLAACASLLGIIGCCIGVLATAPILTMSVALLYDRFFGVVEEGGPIYQPPSYPPG